MYVSNSSERQNDWYLYYQTGRSYRTTTGNEKTMADSDWQDRAVDALEGISSGLKMLGNGSASTPFGAIEAHSMQTREGARDIAGALDTVADALNNVSRSLENIANAILDSRG